MVHSLLSKFLNIPYPRLHHLHLDDHLLLPLDDDDHQPTPGHHLDHLDEGRSQQGDDLHHLTGENQGMDQGEEGVDLMVEEEDLMEEEVEGDMVGLMVDEADMVMMVEEVDMGVEEDTGIEEDLGIEEDTEVEADMVVEEVTAHPVEEEVDHQQEEDGTVQDQGRGRGRDHQSEDRHEEIVQSMVVRGDIPLLDLGLCRVGVEVGVRHLGGRRALVGVSAGVEVGQGVRWGERGVILGVSVGVGLGLGRLCQRSRSLREDI